MPGLGFATGVARCHRLTQPLRVNDVTIMSPSGIITIADTNLYNLKRCGKHDPKLTPSRMSITFPGNDIVVPLPLFSLASRLLSSSNRTKEERFVSDFAQWNEETTSNSVTQFRVLYQNWIYYSFNWKYKRTKKLVRSNSKDVKFSLYEPTINLSPRFRWRHHQRDP